MKKYIISLTILIAFTSCSSNKTIALKYKTIRNLKIEQVTTSYVKISGEIILKNSKFKDANISSPKGLSLFFDNKKIADIKIENFNVPNKKNFSIPISNDLIDYNSIYDKNGGFLRLTLDVAKSKIIMIKIEGELIANSNGFQKKIELTHYEEVTLED